MSATHTQVTIKSQIHEIEITQADGSLRPVIDIEDELVEIYIDAYNAETDDELETAYQRAANHTAQIA